MDWPPPSHFSAKVENTCYFVCCAGENQPYHNPVILCATAGLVAADPVDTVVHPLLSRRSSLQQTSTPVRAHTYSLGVIKVQEIINLILQMEKPELCLPPGQLGLSGLLMPESNASHFKSLTESEPVSPELSLHFFKPLWNCVCLEV